MLPRTKALWTVFLLWHMLALTASFGQDLVAVQWVRQAVTKPYEQLFGLHQTWTMFAPNPPRSSSWLTVEGLTTDGSTVTLVPRSPVPDPDGLIWHYDRMGKFERNIGARKRGSQRSGYARSFCRESRAQGVPLSGVLFTVHKQLTPKPAEHTLAPRSQWAVESHTYRERPCEGE